jgi:hypothetical protein
MLKISVPLAEGFDEETQTFFVMKDFDLELEHSLASLSKWEAKYKKPFLGSGDKDGVEVFDYIKLMALAPDVPDRIYDCLTADNIAAVNEYINDKMTATTFREMGPQRHSQEIITAEIIYYWMVALQIPFECQYWHLNKLITLVRVCNEKNKPARKMSRGEAARRQRELNAQRKANMGTRG